MSGDCEWRPQKKNPKGAVAYTWGVYGTTPVGIFYIVEDHPTMHMFSGSEDGPKLGLKLANPYFFSPTPDPVETQGSYASPDDPETYQFFYIWNHSTGEVLNSLISAGLQIEYLHEFPYAARENSL